MYRLAYAYLSDGRLGISRENETMATCLAGLILLSKDLRVEQSFKDLEEAFETG